MGLVLEDGPKAVVVRRGRAPWWEILSWQLYDFSDTIFSMNIVSMYFGLWVAVYYKAPEYMYGVPMAISMLLVAATSPALGAISDTYQKRLPFLRFFSLAAMIFTGLIGVFNNLYAGILFFVLANFAYNSALSFYNALLPGLSNEKNVSLVSGIGVALGYAGAIIGLLMVKPFAVRNGVDYPQGAFMPTAILYFLFALPCLTLVKDFNPAKIPGFKIDLKAAYRRVGSTFKHAEKYPGLIRFLAADFLYENAVDTIIVFMGVYSSKVVGYSQEDLIKFFMFSTAFAVLGSFIYGPLTDRIGPKTSVFIMLSLWLVVMGAALLSSTKAAFNFIGPLAGVSLGATWISSRTYLVALSPVEKSAEFFGLYSLSGKSASSIGPLVWSAVVFLAAPLGEVAAQKAAVVSLMVFIVVAMILVAGVPNVRPSKENVLQ
ncbi:MAG: MFS transporter [Actinobacteria bacterium]|nr:MFS transporter [Actinomycetota bacterium]